MTHNPIFVVEPEIFVRHPDYVVGCVLARGIDNMRAYTALDDLLSDAEADVRSTFVDADYKAPPPIAVWRTAFAACGWTPSKYPASVEALVKRVAKGGSLPRINPIVDLGNAIVLRCLTPVGAHDLGQLDGHPLTVRESQIGDTFQPSGDTPREAPDTGEIVYAAGHSVRTRRWVWRQAGDALVTAGTRDVLFPVDGFGGATDEPVRQAVEMLATACRDLFGATVTTGMVTAGSATFNDRL